MLVEPFPKQVSQDSGKLVLTDLITKNPQPQRELGLERNSRESRWDPPRTFVVMGTCRTLIPSKPFLLNLLLGGLALEATYSQ